MKLMSPNLIVLVLIAWFISASAQAYSLAPNAQIPVLVYNSFSGAVNTKKNNALLTLYANGRAIASSPSGLEKTIDATLSPLKLQHLLHQLIEQYHFFDINPQAIEQQIANMQEKGKLFNLMDSNTVSIQLHTQEQKKTQLFYGLSATANQYPSIKALKDLAAIEIELQKIRHWLLIGKDEGLGKELALANQTLHQQYPDVSSLTEADLAMVSLPISGERNIHFQHQQRNENNEVIAYVSVYNQYDSKGKVTVVVTVHSN